MLPTLGYNRGMDGHSHESPALSGAAEHSAPRPWLRALVQIAVGLGLGLFAPYPHTIAGLCLLVIQLCAGLALIGRGCAVFVQPRLEETVIGLYFFCW